MFHLCFRRDTGLTKAAKMSFLIYGIACVTAPQGSIGHRLHLNSFKGLVSPMSDKFLVFYMSDMMRFLQFYGY